MDIKKLVESKAQRAREASRKLAILSTAAKNSALLAMGASLIENRAQILEENQKDLEAAQDKVKKSMLDRLALNENRIAQMAEGLYQTAALPDPIGRGEFETIRPNGIRIRKIHVPLGVIGIIFESRPNVTADAAALCLKSGNACLLRGGSEAIRSNIAISKILQTAAEKSGIPSGAIEFIDVTDREAVGVMTSLTKFIDVIIPRGGAGLIQRVKMESRVPVIETGVGVCHTFVDESADLDKALAISINAKTSRPSVCNAMETLLIHESIAEKFLPIVAKSMREKNVELRGCSKCKKILPDIIDATEEDWAAEYNDLILSIKIVKDVDEAIDHINRFGTQHSETIVTNDLSNARKFQNEIDAAAVYVNVSTRFTDGFEFGFGAEIGISTQKMHARGPMGLNELTSTKYLIDGDGQIR